MSAQQRPRREVVRSVPGQTRGGVRISGAPVPQDPYVAALMHRQLRTAVGSALLLVLLVGSLPLDFALVPGLAGARIDGVGVAWVVLGVLVYPVLLLIGRLHLRGAERNERGGPEGEGDGYGKQRGTGAETGADGL